jgi:tetratricopeptide (TPR) repeat protein
MTGTSQEIVSKAFELATAADAERVAGNQERSTELARQALESIGLCDETSYVEAIESRVFNSADCRAELEQLLDILASALSFEHPAVRDTFERLIQRWESWCSDYSALLAPIYDRLIVLRIAQIGPEHQEIADRLMNYAEYLSGCGRNFEAQNCLTRAVTIRKSRLGKSPSAKLSYAQSVTRLGCLLMSMNNYEVAERYLKLAVDMLEETRSGLKLHALEDLGTVYIETGRREHAEEILKKALSMDGGAIAIQSVANCSIQLGGIYLHWRRIEDAFALFDFSMTFDRSSDWTLPDLSAMETIADEIDASSNPYLEIFELLNNRYSASDARRFGRDSLVRKYSWAIPDEEALATIGSYTPLVEIGAGTGYWAALLRKRGADMIAYDSHLAETGKIALSLRAKVGQKYWRERRLFLLIIRIAHCYFVGRLIKTKWRIEHSRHTKAIH